METENTETKTESKTTFKKQNKVTVGFKCHPELKIALIKEAAQLDISLSEYMESLVLNQREENKAAKEIENNKIAQHQKTITELKQRLDFYENNLLMDLYNAHKDQVIDYVNIEGETMEIKITEITDVYTVLVNSFKINKP